MVPLAEQEISCISSTLCKLSGKTGVEMEALTAASVAALTIYDMYKAVQKGHGYRAGASGGEKGGGKSGHFQLGETKGGRHDQGSVFAQVRELVGCDELSLRLRQCRCPSRRLEQAR